LWKRGKRKPCGKEGKENLMDENQITATYQLIVIVLLACILRTLVRIGAPAIRQNTYHHRNKRFQAPRAQPHAEPTYSPGKPRYKGRH